MKKILLTGGSGFIGRNIKESYLNEKYNIVAPTHNELDLLDTESVNNYFKNNRYFDIVLHTATKAGHRNARDLTNLTYSNLRMFYNLEKNSHYYGKFINFGSGAIYDISKNIVNNTEYSQFDNIGKDEHSFCKYIIGKQIQNLNKFIDLNIFGIFGKYEDWEIRFISNAICRAISDMPIILNQNRLFSYLWIDDLMPILEYFIENKNIYHSYNIVPDERIDLKEIPKIINNIMGKNIEVITLKDGDGLCYTGNNSRLKKEFRDIKFTSIDKSINLLYNYYKENMHLIDKNLLKLHK